MISKIDRHSFALLSHTAERQTRAMTRRLELLLRAQVHSAADYVREGHHIDAVVKELAEHWHKSLVETKTKWALRYAVDGYTIAGGLMGKRAFLPEMESKLLESAEGKASLIGFGSEELVANHLRARVGDWVDMTSNLETATSARRLGKLYEDGMRGQIDPTTGTIRSLTPHELANYILSEELADVPARAELMARTMTNWGYNEGANQVYKDEGINQKEWLTTEYGADIEIVRCKCRRDELVHAGDKWRAKRIWVLKS